MTIVAPHPHPPKKSSLTVSCGITLFSDLLLYVNIREKDWFY